MFEITIAILFILSVFSFYSIAPWVPTKNKDLERIGNIVQLKNGEKFLEIGCGTARISIMLAKKYPEAHIYGIELSPLFFSISWIKAKLSGQKNITILLGNALKEDYSKYDVIYIFGMPDILKNTFAPKLEKELQKHARFYSYTFKMNETSLYEKKFKKDEEHALYEYKKQK